MYEISNKEEFVLLRLARRNNSANNNAKARLTVLINNVSFPYKPYQSKSEDFYEEIEFREGEMEKAFKLDVKNILEVATDKFAVQVDASSEASPQSLATVFIRQNKSNAHIQSERFFLKLFSCVFSK